MTAVPPAPPAGCPIAVAFCPAPPVLLPAVAKPAAPGLSELREACAEAMSAPLSRAPEGGPVWRAVRAALAGRRAEATLHCEDAPFGVGYLVADRQLP